MVSTFCSVGVGVLGNSGEVVGLGIGVVAWTVAGAGEGVSMALGGAVGVSVAAGAIVEEGTRVDGGGA